MDIVADVDRSLFRAIFRVKWRPLDSLMRLFTLLGSAGFIWGVTAFVVFGFVWFSSDLDLVLLLVPWVSIAGSWTVAECAKFFVKRSRPFIRDTEIAPLIKTPSSSSFPSGHSATAAAGAITLSVLYPAFLPVFVVVALLVMLSRIYLGVHYPFDVLAGATIGAVVSVLVLLVS